MPVRWSSVLIRVSLWGDDLPPQRVRLPAQVPQHLLGQVSGLVADLPERLGPASVHAAATASTNTSGNRRPRGLSGSGTRASTASRPGTFPAAFLITLVTAAMRACGTVPAAFRSGLARRRHP